MGTEFATSVSTASLNHATDPFSTAISCFWSSAGKTSSSLLMEAGRRTWAWRLDLWAMSDGRGQEEGSNLVMRPGVVRCLLCAVWCVVACCVCVPCAVRVAFVLLFRAGSVHGTWCGSCFCLFNLSAGVFFFVIASPTWGAKRSPPEAVSTVTHHLVTLDLTFHSHVPIPVAQRSTPVAQCPMPVAQCL